MVSIYALNINYTFCAASEMNGKLVKLIMKVCIELVPNLTAYTILDWFYATFRVFSFESTKQYEAYRIDALSC